MKGSFGMVTPRFRPPLGGGGTGDGTMFDGSSSGSSSSPGTGGVPSGRRTWATAGTSVRPAVAAPVGFAVGAAPCRCLKYS